MSEREAFGDFTGKWRARWPEWAVIEAFVPPARRDVAVAWFALQQELADAAWGGSDAAPGLAKLAWWQDELRGWTRSARRHPLGLVLQPLSAEWGALALALPALRQRDLPERPLAEGLATLRAWGESGSAVELALFGPPACDAGAISAGLLAERVALADRADVVQGLASRLLSASPAGARVGRLHRTMLAARLEAASRGRPWQPPSRWRSLWKAWRSARN